MCNESSLLFNLYIADLNLELKKRNIGDVELEGDRQDMEFIICGLCSIKNRRKIGALQDMIDTQRVSFNTEVLRIVWKKQKC